MGSKFRLSPMIESYVSQRLEDRNRDKKKRQVTFDLEERARPGMKENIKMGPPSKKSEVVNKAKIIDLDEESIKVVDETRALHLKGKSLPYVDVPPLKAALRQPVIDPVKSDHIAKFGPAYKSRAPVEIGVDIEKLVESVLDLEISVPLRSLAGVSGAIQKEIRKQVTKSRLPIENGQNDKVNLLIEDGKPLINVGSLPLATYMVMTEVSDEIPEGHLVASDPILQYLMENKDAEPGSLKVARSSEPLRAIYMTINRVGQEECLLDNGSMIVSMARDAAVQMGLTWDPVIQINMESASNHVEKTLGLARNVRFAVGGLNLYLQVHILANPPYRILLGRPFEVFTGCMTKTDLDGSSELVLTDPNTNEKAIVPTYQRGHGPEELLKQRYQGF